METSNIGKEITKMVLKEITHISITAKRRANKDDIKWVISNVSIRIDQD